MADHQKKTTSDLNGGWLMNRELSDSLDPILQVQGIGFLTRKALTLATIHLDIKQYDDDTAPPMTNTKRCTYIESSQTASGLKGTQELRVLDNELRDHYDWLIGNVKGRSQWIGCDDIQDAVLKEGWLVESAKGLVLTSALSPKNGWTVTQIWGFQMVQGERRFCMRVLAISKSDQKVYARFVFDYQAK